MHLCIYKCSLACKVILGSVSGILKYTSALFKSVLTHLELCVSLAYSEPWNIPITKYIQYGMIPY